MKLVIEINMDGAAFEEYPEQEVERILKRWFHRLDDNGLPVSGEVSSLPPDSNGNKCGTARVVES